VLRGEQRQGPALVRGEQGAGPTCHVHEDAVPALSVGILLHILHHCCFVHLRPHDASRSALGPLPLASHLMARQLWVGENPQLPQRKTAPRDLSRRMRSRRAQRMACLG